MAANLGRPLTGVACVSAGHKQELEPGRCSGEGASSSGWSAQRSHRLGGFASGRNLLVDRVHFGFKLARGHGTGEGRVSQLYYGERLCRGPICLMRGVNGAFWEGADSSDSPANVHYTSQDQASETEGSVLFSLIRDIEPLDISLISKDASPDSTSAMKRTISGMLGLLPSDQFQVTIRTPPDHLARLLVSSMMTGYTLRNAEYRLCLQRSLDLFDDDAINGEVLQRPGPGDENPRPCHFDDVFQENLLGPLESGDGGSEEPMALPDDLGDVSAKAASYIQELQAKLATSSKELEECKNALSALELIRLENNDLLDYLRSLPPEKVAELSQPSPEVHDAVEQVVTGILGTMAPKVSPQVPPFGTSTLTRPWEESGSPETIGNVPLQFQASVTLTSTRDYLARLLFWCTLLGYHMRGLEYRLELSRTLSLSGGNVFDADGSRPDSQAGSSCECF